MIERSLTPLNQYLERVVTEPRTAPTVVCTYSLTLHAVRWTASPLANSDMNDSRTYGVKSGRVWLNVSTHGQRRRRRGCWRWRSQQHCPARDWTASTREATTMASWQAFVRGGDVSVWFFLTVVPLSTSLRPLSDRWHGERNCGPLVLPAISHIRSAATYMRHHGSPCNMIFTQVACCYSSFFLFTIISLTTFKQQTLRCRHKVLR